MSDGNRPLPTWLGELERLLPIRSQFYLYGNIYDRHLRPNFRGVPEGAEVPLMELLPLLRMFLGAQGFRRVLYFDLIDQFDLFEFGRSSELTIESLLDELPPSNGRESLLAKFRGASAHATVDDALLLFQLVLKAATHERPTATILNYVSRLATNPSLLDPAESQRFIRLHKVAGQAQAGAAVMLCLCDKLSDVPTWLLRDSPLTHGIEIPRPDVLARRAVFEVRCEPRLRFAGKESRKLSVDLFADQTEGMAARECDGMIELCRRGAGDDAVGPGQVRACLDLYKYGERESPWGRLDRERVEAVERALRARVRGQESAVIKAVSIVQRAALGLHDLGRRADRPKGVLFFAGPTGTGKTEFAKTLARALFNTARDEALLRFDMSEYSHDHSDERLIGAPPGYVGYEEGGQLTSAVRARPFRILLFDEIDKAHRGVFDKFLQILDDGRLTDGRGQTVYFGETLIVFTSNLGFGDRAGSGGGAELEPYEAMERRVTQAIRSFFVTELKRPEIYNRFGENFVVFDYIRPTTAREILADALDTMRRTLLERRRCELSWSDGFCEAFFDVYVRENLENGGRGILNKVEEHIENGLSRHLFQLGRVEGARVRVSLVQEEAQCKPRVAFTALA